MDLSRAILFVQMKNLKIGERVYDILSKRVCIVIKSDLYPQFEDMLDITIKDNHKNDGHVTEFCLWRFKKIMK